MSEFGFSFFAIAIAGSLALAVLAVVAGEIDRVKRERELDRGDDRL
jgi:type II secretory pathway pseudopilin PulG